MAFDQFTATFVGTADAYGVPVRITIERPVSSATASGSATTDAVAVAAAIAVLVADGATPTQAHVNTLNSAYTTLAADIVAVAAAAAGAVSVSVDLSKITTITQLEAVLKAIMLAARASKDFGKS